MSAAWSPGELLERRCVDHPTRQVIQRPHRSICECESGHDVETWLVYNVTRQRFVGASHYQRGGYVEGAETIIEALLRRAMARTCGRGHVGQMEPRLDHRGQRCRACHSEDGKRWFLRNAEEVRRRNRDRRRALREARA